MYMILDWDDEESAEEFARQMKAGDLRIGMAYRIQEHATVVSGHLDGDRVMPDDLAELEALRAKVAKLEPANKNCGCTGLSHRSQCRYWVLPL